MVTYNTLRKVFFFNKFKFTGAVDRKKRLIPSNINTMNLTVIDPMSTYQHNQLLLPACLQRKKSCSCYRMPKIEEKNPYPSN